MRTTDEDGLDTALARLLHDEGSVSLPVLEACLEEVRRRRDAEPVTLAGLLVERGWVAEPVAEAAQARLAQDPTLVERARQLVTPPAEPATPPQLGPYRLVRKLARGGMGSVHEAVHEETSGRYAVKTLLPWLMAEDVGEDRDRFAREVEALARLRHPHVVSIHTANLEGPTPYLVLDLITGGSLWERIQRGPVEVAEAVEITIALSKGLKHCHAHGILHRDLKPQNVLLDDEGRPYLADFGLARLTDAQRLTQTGALLGTPAYMAPEQAHGSGAFDVRTDVYGLGTILYALLTGRPPFQGSGLYAVLNKVISEAPRPPSADRPEVPAWLERVCLQALAKASADRYPSAQAFGEALERGDPGSDSEHGAWPWLIAAAAAALVVVGAIAFAHPTPEPTQTPPPVADPRATSLPRPVHPASSSPATSTSRWIAPGRQKRTLGFPGAKEVSGALVGGRLLAVTSDGRIWEQRLADLDTGRSPRVVGRFDPGRTDTVYPWPTVPIEIKTGWIVSVRGGDLVLVGRHGREVERDKARVRSIAWRGQRVATVSRLSSKGGLEVFDLALGSVNQAPLNQDLSDVGFLADGRVVACGPDRVVVWDPRQSAPKPEVALRYDPSVLATHDTHVTLGTRDGQLESFRTIPRAPFLERTRSFPGSVTRHRGSIRGLCYARNGTVLFAVGAPKSGPNRLQAWDSRTGEPIREPLEVSGRVLSLTLDASGELLVLGSTSSRLTLVSVGAVLDRTRRR